MARIDEVVRHPASRIGRAAAVLARAFRDDPMMRYLIPDDGRRARLLPWFLGSLVRYSVAYGKVYAGHRPCFV